jgi:AraC-like DNA-binding protein
VRSETGDRADLLQRALGVVDERLADPGLSPAAVAAALYVSERTLYGAFREAGLSIAGTIRTRRLEQARRELIDPAHAGDSVSGIAARWGFSSSTHFSALFRDVFGSSPSAYRGAHAQR